MICTNSIDVTRVLLLGTLVEVLTLHAVSMVTWVAFALIASGYILTRGCPAAIVTTHGTFIVIVTSREQLIRIRPGEATVTRTQIRPDRVLTMGVSTTEQGLIACTVLNILAGSHVLIQHITDVTQTLVAPDSVQTLGIPGTRAGIGRVLLAFIHVQTLRSITRTNQ